LLNLSGDPEQEYFADGGLTPLLDFEDFSLSDGTPHYIQGEANQPQGNRHRAKRAVRA
jgi:hypothetical protein